jgi:hypothetical protein
VTDDRSRTYSARGGGASGAGDVIGRGADHGPGRSRTIRGIYRFGRLGAATSTHSSAGQGSASASWLPVSS